MTGQIKLLRAEITGDPLAIGYSGMNDAEVVTSINAPAHEENKTSLTNSEMLAAIVPSALVGLTGDKATRVWGVLGMATIDPFGPAEDIFKDAFDNNSPTIVALAALRKRNVSRANVLGYPGKVKIGHVEQARNNTSETIKPPGTSGPEKLKMPEVGGDA